MIRADGIAGGGRDCRGGRVLAVRFIGGDLDAVGGPIISHVEIYRLPHVPELHIVVAADGVGLQVNLLTIHKKGLAGRFGHKARRIRCAAAEQGRAHQHSCYESKSPFHVKSSLKCYSFVDFSTNIIT